MTNRIRGVVVAGMVVAGLAVPARASDPMGVYCIIDKVTLEPADCPERAQISGVCAQASLRDSTTFQSPARGYFYFSVPTGKEEQARSEWADLKSAAGTGQVIGFGRRYSSVGKFRTDDGKPADPDTYPVWMGVMKVTGRTVAPEVNEVAQKLRAFK